MSLPSQVCQLLISFSVSNDSLCIFKEIDFVKLLRNWGSYQPLAIWGEYTICTQHFIRPVIWLGAIWTTRGEGRFTGVIILPLLYFKKYSFILEN